MILKSNAKRAALKALKERRLFWRVSDQYGRSCNGGDRSFRLSPAIEGRCGEWSPRIDGEVEVCECGYHATSDPLKWRGLRVALVEVREIEGSLEDKVVCRQFRELGVVEPWECIDIRIWVAATRPHLSRADLSGAYLSRANLSRANLSGADLSGAYLSGADLEGWERGDDGYAKRK